MAITQPLPVEIISIACTINAYIHVGIINCQCIHIVFLDFIENHQTLYFAGCHSTAVRITAAV